MKKSLLLALFAIAFSCKNKSSNDEIDYKPSFTSVTADTLLSEEISIRALTIDNEKVWYAGSRGKYGWISLNGGKNFSGVAVQDTLIPEFRAIAQTKTDVFILNVGTPALLYKISKDGKRSKLVYTENGEKVFYDSMQFTNDKDGIAMGDPTDNCLSVIITNDGGDTWTKVPCDKLPKITPGEAAFAASNTNIITKGDKIWMVSGGKKSRVFYSKDKAISWEVYNTPIVQGSEMTGIFSADFYNDTLGFAVGGDYEKPEKNSGNKMITTDGGKNWELIGEGKGFGYASCVQFVPGSNGNEIVTIGPSGLYYSYNKGKDWEKLLDHKTLHTIRFIDAKTAIAAGQNKIIRLRFK